MGAIGLYAVYDRNGTEILDNATMQEVADKIGSSKASVANAISAGYSVKKDMMWNALTHRSAGRIGICFAHSRK